jgi:hypothetical protein
LTYKISGGENKMKKKIIFMAFCLILLLIFTALSYGGADPKKLREDPWQHMLSPKPDNNQNLELVILVINPHFYLIFKSPSRAENFRNLTELTNQKSDDSIKYNSLNRDETNSKE